MGEIIPTAEHSTKTPRRCCDGHNCRRSQPMHLRRSGLTRTWYVVTDERDEGNGIFYAKARHQLPEDEQERLTEMADAKSWLDAIVEQMGSREAILDALDLTMRKVAE